MSLNAQIDESLCKICHYQQNVPQYYYNVFDTLVVYLYIIFLSYIISSIDSLMTGTFAPTNDSLPLSVALWLS